MIIPQLFDGIIPPYVGNPTHNSPKRSPYQTTIKHLVHTFGTSSERLTILQNFIFYRRRLFQIGIKNGVQILDGSFVQQLDCEPNDIDVLTIWHRGTLPTRLVKIIMENNPSLFYPTLTKRVFKTDAYFLDVQAQTYYSYYRWICYWFGLFSHTRHKQWKGILEIPLPKSYTECLQEQTTVENHRIG